MTLFPSFASVLLFGHDVGGKVLSCYTLPPCSAALPLSQATGSGHHSLVSLNSESDDPHLCRYCVSGGVLSSDRALTNRNQIPARAGVVAILASNSLIYPNPVSKNESHSLLQMRKPDNWAVFWVASSQE